MGELTDLRSSTFPQKKLLLNDVALKATRDAMDNTYEGSKLKGKARERYDYVYSAVSQILR